MIRIHLITKIRIFNQHKIQGLYSRLSASIGLRFVLMSKVNWKRGVQKTFRFGVLTLHYGDIEYLRVHRSFRQFPPLPRRLSLHPRERRMLALRLTQNVDAITSLKHHSSNSTNGKEEWRRVEVVPKSIFICPINFQKFNNKADTDNKSVWI